MPSQIAFHERDARALHRHVGAGVLRLALVMLGPQENRLALRHLVGRPVGDDDELAGFDLCLYVEDAVLGNADPVEARAQRAHPADHRRPFERPEIQPRAGRRRTAVRYPE